MKRLSARLLVTVFAVLLTATAIFLLAAVVQQSLAGNAAARDDASAAVGTMAILVLLIAALSAWFFSTYMLQPLWQLRRDLRLTARSRALAEPYAGETADVRDLRETLLTVLRDLEEEIRSARSETLQVLSMIGEASEGILQIDAEGRFVHVNRAARALLSLPPRSEGQTIPSLIRNTELREVLQHAIAGHTLAPVEIVFDGRQLLIAPRPLTHEGGGAVATVVDLTQLRRLESARRDFVANVSHELKTPLTVIRGYAETLLDEELSRADQMQFLEVISRNAQRLQRVVEELLDLSRLQSGGWIPDLQPLELSALVRDIWLDCEPSMKRQRIEFSVHGGPALVLADQDGLQQILSNIYDNALRYTPENGRIETHFTTRDDHVLVEISDNGSGIPATSLPRIFERFYRVDAARSRAEGGTGLGLAIVKHLTERMNGTVWATSILGSGTTIHLQLPAAPTP